MDAISANSASASRSSWSVSASTKYEPPSGSITFATPVSCARICCVRSATCTDCSVGSASVSSREFVWSDCVAPRTGGGGLVRHADDVIQRLLRRERDARGLTVEPHHPGARLPRLVALAHVPRPDPACRAQLRNLLEEVVVDVPEEGKTRGEAVDVEPPRDSPLDVRETVGERERELLGGRRAGFANVVAGDGDRVPQRCVFRAPFEHVHDDLERRLDRIGPGVLGHVLLEDVVLHGSTQNDILKEYMAQR